MLDATWIKTSVSRKLLVAESDLKNKSLYDVNFLVKKLFKSNKKRLFGELWKHIVGESDVLDIFRLT